MQPTKGQSFLPKELEGLLKDLGKSNPALAASATAFVTGCLLMLDDAKDFGKFSGGAVVDSLHHWMWGALLMLGGTGALGFALLEMISKLPPPSKRPPVGLLEQGFPLEQIERMK